MSTINDALKFSLGQLGFSVLDNVEPGPASNQATGAALQHEVVRVTKSVANGLM